MQSAQEIDSIPRVLDALCRRTLSVIGPPAATVAVLEQRDQELEILSQIGTDGTPPLPRQWPIAGSIAGVVLNQKRTAYVSDLTLQPDLSRPFEAGAFKSVLATPVSLAGSNRGLLVVCSVDPAHWSEEQFRVIEWVAGQCGLIMESLKHQKAHAAKYTFLAMLSHELRTPLTPILVTSEMLEHDSRLPDDVRSHCRMIRRNVGVQCRLIDDLLDLTRISRGKIELNRQPVPIAALLRDTAQIVSNDLNAKSQTLNLDVAALEGCAVVGDEPRLQQVFWNLLKNAIKFSDAGASVSIVGHLEDECVVVEVSDQGCGIDSEDLERVFLPFEQTQAKPRNANDGGLGLGLTIAKAMRLFPERSFDLVISDSGLPDDNGLELLRRIRFLRPDIPAICISGYGMDRDIEECHEAGFRAHLTKPVEPNRLKTTIAKLLAENAEMSPAPQSVR